MNQSNTSDRNSYHENDKNNIFIVMKNKMGYLVPLNAKHSIYKDTDFTNSFIIKSQMEAKDSKSVYAYYILTKNDFTVTNISSSTLYLGLSMDLLKKHMIKMDILILKNL